MKSKTNFPNLRFWGFIAFTGVLVFWFANLSLLYFVHDSTSRGLFGDMFGAVNALFSGLGFAGLVLALLLQQHQISEARMQSIEAAEAQRKFLLEEARANNRDATHEIFLQWWSRDLWKLRNYFYSEFLQKHYAKVATCSLKQVRQVVPEDNGQLIELTGFFDRVGWLGAAHLIDVDYVLGPMQHVVRRVWFVTEPLIRKARGSSESWFDPAFHLGFEWLFLRTLQQDNDHASLLNKKFSEPDLFTPDQFLVLKQMIATDETAFRKFLEQDGPGSREDT